MNKQFLGLIIIMASSVCNIDIFFPALPKICQDINCPNFYLQMLLSGTMFIIAFFSLIWSPISLKFGFNKMCILCITLFCLGNIFNAISFNFISFAISRYISAIGGSGVAVAVVMFINNNFTGKSMAKQFAFLGFINTSCLVIAPAIGGFISKYFVWRLSFVFLVITAFPGIVLFLKNLKNYNKNTHPPSQHTLMDQVKTSIQSYKKLAKNPSFLVYSLFPWVLVGSSISYQSNGSSILQKFYSVSPVEFGIVMGIPFMVSSCFNLILTKLINKLTLLTIFLMGCGSAIIGSTLLLIFTLCQVNFWLLLIPIGFHYLAITLTSSPCSVTSLEIFPQNKSEASSFSACLRGMGMGLGLILSSFVIKSLQYSLFSLGFSMFFNLTLCLCSLYIPYKNKILVSNKRE